ncbi:MAG: hypothetical protein J6C64_03640 [Lachnospiraceae bacterium]|nr:hypothetical protein [Lachnospiraceae bacterium]
MAAILYLSNKLVQMVEAKGKGRTVEVQNVWQEEAPEGSIINGIITDEEAFLAWIKEFFAKNKLPRKEIALVVNSSQFTHRVLEFPKVKDAEIKKMIPREFAEQRTENTLFTYYILDGEASSKKQKLLATAVEKEFLMSYISFFRQAGIEICSIDSGISTFVRLFMNSPEIANRTCIVQILDGQEVISMLFVKGMYYYSQKNRIFSDNLPQELGSITGKLLQFATSQQIKEPIDTMYLCGDGQNELKGEMIDSRIFTGNKVIFTDRNVKRKNVEFIYSAGFFLGKKQGMSFYRQLRQEKKKQKEFLSLLLPSGAVILVGLLVTAIMGNTYFSGTQELKKLQNTMHEKEMANNNASYELALASIDAMKNKMEVVEGIWLHLMSYPTINSSVEQVLEECAQGGVSVEIKSFQRDSGVLTLEASAADIRSINGFIAALQEKELFEAVDYSGYTYVSGLDSYNIHVVCCMAEGAGR